MRVHVDIPVLGETSSKVKLDSNTDVTGGNMEWLDAGEMVKLLNQKLGG